MLINREQLVSEFSEALSKDKGVFFVGSGISMESGLPTWDGLLESYSPALYNFAKNKPLPLVAQYIVNESLDKDYALKRFIAEKVKAKYSIHNKYLEQIVNTKVNKIWTTNYDTLIEDAFGSVRCAASVGDHSIDKGMDRDTVEVIKMHGCRTCIDTMVLTQSDYDFFQYDNPNTCRRLLSDMSESLFLFIGYGFRDHNIHNVLIASTWKNRTPAKRHFLITKKDKSEHELQQLWAKDLIRYGIYVLYIDEYDELESILKEIASKSRGKRIYVTGAHDDINNPIAEEIGRFLAEKDDVIVLDGQAQGVGAAVLREFNAACLVMRKERANRLESFHNPYAVDARFASTAGLMDTLKAHRTPLFRNAQLVVLFDGGIGTRAEFQLAQDLGCNILPVPKVESPGHYTAFMEKEVLQSPHVCNYLEFFPGYKSKIDNRADISANDIIRCLGTAIDRF